MCYNYLNIHWKYKYNIISRNLLLLINEKDSEDGWIGKCFLLSHKSIEQIWKKFVSQIVYSPGGQDTYDTFFLMAGLSCGTVR